MKPSDGISIIIPSRADVLGLWSTITACETLLGDVPHEFIAMVNGQEKQEVHYLLEERSGVWVKYSNGNLPMPPPIARNFGATYTKYPTLCFLDDHVIPTAEFFNWNLDAQVVHCSYKTYPRHELRYYHFKYNEAMPTKGDYATMPPFETGMTPFPCLSGPHGGFFVDRKYFLDSGGYDDFWQGFGGEEAYFGIKANLLGAKVVCNPNALFYHFSCREGVRGYSKEFNEFNFTEGLKRLKELGDVDALLKKFEHHKL